MSCILQPCVPTPSVTGDLIDNDCDGLIDEEMCHEKWRGTGNFVAYVVYTCSMIYKIGMDLEIGSA